MDVCFPKPLSGEHKLLCAVCGFDYVFIESVEKFPYGRGSRVEIIYQCEASHRFSVTQDFHKGQVFVQTTELAWKDHPTG